VCRWHDREKEEGGEPPVARRKHQRVDGVGDCGESGRRQRKAREIAPTGALRRAVEIEVAERFDVTGQFVHFLAGCEGHGDALR